MPLLQNKLKCQCSKILWDVSGIKHNEMPMLIVPKMPKKWNSKNKNEMTFRHCKMQLDADAIRCNENTNAIKCNENTNAIKCNEMPRKATVML